MERTINIHTRKYYRVVLESIDANRETPESFAVKLTLRLRMTTPRAKAVAYNLPNVIRSNLSSTDANKLKAVLESIGGVCRLETHFVTPGEERPLRRQESKQPVEGETFNCPQCGSEEPADAKYCSLCYRKFRQRGNRANGLGSRIPEHNPLGDFDDEGPAEAAKTEMALWLRYGWIVAAAAVLVVALIFFVK